MSYYNNSHIFLKGNDKGVCEIYVKLVDSFPENDKICSMIEQPPKEENLFIIKEIEVNPTTTQRILSEKLGISLGKTNYLLKELIKKGLIKAKNFSDNPGKMQKIHYYLTKNGLEEKMRLMSHFLNKKEIEYNLIKREWETVLMKQQMIDNNLEITASEGDTVNAE